MILENIHRLHVYGYEYTGYVSKIDCVAGYYKANMDMLLPEVQKDLFYQSNSSCRSLHLADDGFLRSSFFFYLVNCLRLCFLWVAGLKER